MPRDERPATWPSSSLSLQPGIKCLFMSGYTADVIAHQGVLEEGVSFISKPFSLDGLARKAGKSWIPDGRAAGPGD